MSEEEKAELQELYENSVWWHNRYNAVQRDYENLHQKIDKANEILSNILVIKRSDGNYGAIKNTRKKEVYEAICMLNEILETPHRTNYNLLGDKENVNK